MYVSDGRETNALLVLGESRASTIFPPLSGDEITYIDLRGVSSVS